jgi:hypothetical protein
MDMDYRHKYDILVMMMMMMMMAAMVSSDLESIRVRW